MSSGSQSKDMRKYYPAPQGGGYYAGLFRKKDWNGVDYPKGRDAPIIAWRPPKPIYRKGKLVGYKRPTPVRGRRPKRARVEEHPYTVTWNTFDSVPMRLLDYPGDPTPIDFSSDGVLLINGVSPAWTSHDELALLGKLREKVAGSDFNLGVFLAEGHQALEMITNAASRIYRSVTALKKGNLKAARRALIDGTTNGRGRPAPQKGVRKDLANNWLELQYGWLPLLKDAEASAQFLAHMLGWPMQEIVRVSRQVPTTISYVSPSFSYEGYTTYSRKSIKCILKEKDVAKLVGLTDPLSVVWEKLPWSFVIDWFIPIGNYLSARGLAQALTGTFVTSVRTGVVAGGLKVNTTSGIYSKLLANEPTQKIGSFTRTVSSSLSVPLPSMKSFNSVTSWRHCANAVALLLQVKR